MADVSSKLQVVISANTAQMSGQIAKATKSIGLLNSTLGSLKGYLLGAFGGHQIIRGIQNAISTIADFEKQMDKVRAITGATGTDFTKLEKNALDLGRATEYTARQIAGLQVEYGRLGFSSREILNSTKATLNLATATGEDLTRSAEIAGSTLRAFQLDATEMGRVTDVITGALNKSALALDSFADGMKYVAPVAEATNVSIEETSALLGILADAGIKGSQAGTSLRRIFTLLDRSGKPVVERLKELAAQGITLADANDEVGLYAQTALLVITKQIDRFEELTTVLENLNGEAERTAEIMRDNLSGDFDKLKSAMEGVVLEGGAFNGFFRGLTQNLTNTVSLLNDKAIPAWERYWQFVSLPLTGGAGITGLFHTAEEIAKAAAEVAKIQEEATKKTAESIDRQAKQGLETFGTTAKGLEALKAAYSSNVNGLEIYKRAVEFAKDELKKETTAQLDNVKARLEAIEARKKEFKLIRDIRNAEFEALKEKDLPTDVDFSGAFNPSLFNNPKLGGLLDEDTQRLAQEAADNYDLVFDRIVEGTERMTKATEDNNKALIDQAQNYARIASAASDAIAQGIAGEKTFAQVLSSTTASIVDSLEAQALAYMIKNQARFGLPGIIAATAGFAVVKGLFSRISKQGRGGEGGGAYGGSNSGISSSSYSLAQDSSVRITGETVIKGQDLYIAFKNYSDSKYSTHG